MRNGGGFITIRSPVRTEIELNNWRSFAVSKMNMIRILCRWQSIKSRLPVRTVILTPLAVAGTALMALAPLGCSTSAEKPVAAKPVEPAKPAATTAPAAPSTPAPAATSATANPTAEVPTQVIESRMEFLASGDFNGDGQVDVAIISREKGRVRFGYRQSSEFFNWTEWRASGVSAVTGVSVGRLVDAKHDSLAIASADANQIAVLDAANPNVPTEPILITTEAQGPNAAVAVDIGGTDNSPLLDLYVTSIYNNDPENRLTLFRAGNKNFTQIYDQPTTTTATRGSRVTLKTGGPEEVACTVKTPEGPAWRVENLTSGKPETVLLANGVPDDAGYFLGNFRGQPTKDVVFFKRGQANFSVGALAESGGKFQLGALKSIALATNAQEVALASTGGKSRLFVVYEDVDPALDPNPPHYGTKSPAELLDFDGVNLPVALQKFEVATNKSLTCGIVLPDAVLMFSMLTNQMLKDVAYYQVFVLKDGKFVPGSFGGLPTLDDRDDNTIPSIYERIVSAQTEKTQADMKVYTNSIPGTQVTFAMTPIPAGEFTMGTPDTEAGRKADESPLHKVKIEPFWMGTYEVTWDQYLLFVYPDDEKKLRETHPTDSAINAISDAVSHPTKPYMDMSFGMGKSGFPAVAMTQHAANKFCHWLSAKTGQFYRLPTEAEWEYACRAGTTTVYSYGDDPSQLENYAWFFDNSSSKYQKVGKKKPNPWGLYDMHGNVTEWVLDQYDPNYYKTLGTGLVTEPWNKATKPYPHSVRGGSWDDDAVALRSGARRGSDRQWKMTDPQLPKGKWWHTDAAFVGFRVVRPLKVPTAEEMARYWISGVEKD